MDLGERIKTEAGKQELYEELKRRDVVIAIPAIQALTEWEDRDRYCALPDIDVLIVEVRSRLAEDEDLMLHMHYKVPLGA